MLVQIQNDVYKKNQNNDALRQFSDLGESFMILHRFLLNKLKFSKDVKYPPKHLVN